MATFIVHLNMSPTEYKKLTIRERNAIIAETEKKNKQRPKSK